MRQCGWGAMSLVAWCGLFVQSSRLRGGWRLREGRLMERSMDERARWIALYVLCTGMLMIVLDVTVVNVALPSIQDDLGFMIRGLRGW